MSTRVRTATAQDAGLVGRLLDDFNREYSSPTPGCAILAGRLRHLLAGDSMVALVANEGDGVALVTFRPSIWYPGPVGTLDELYVVPALRGSGIGSSLLAAAEGALWQRGGVLLEINVDGEDTGARRFYERHGYRNTERGSAEQLLYYYREIP